MELSLWKNIANTSTHTMESALSEAVIARLIQLKHRSPYIQAIVFWPARNIYDFLALFRIFFQLEKLMLTALGKWATEGMLLSHLSTRFQAYFVEMNRECRVLGWSTIEVLMREPCRLRVGQNLK